jgi:hypothetical protein
MLLTRAGDLLKSPVKRAKRAASRSAVQLIARDDESTASTDQERSSAPTAVLVGTPQFDAMPASCAARRSVRKITPKICN